MNNSAPQLFEKPDNVVTRWYSFENPSGTKGGGGKENKGAKGHPSDVLLPGKSFVLMDADGPGVVRRIWMTVDCNNDPIMLRALRIDIFWDHAKKPAVSAPLGDFFGVAHGRKKAFESELFSDPEGKSFNCFVPMPFRKHAKIVLTNESTVKKVALFYDVNATLGDDLGANTMYFHAHWHREQPTTLGRDFDILPAVEGAGRFLGSNIGVIENLMYHYQWFGEGEIKMFLDGDAKHPTLIGTGTEDYIGAAWGQGLFANRTQGCLVADRDAKMWAFYRHHIPDPVWFNTGCRVTMQQIGGAPRSRLLQAIKRGAKVKMVTIARDFRIIKALESSPPMKVDDRSLEENIWCNYYREDDVCATAYFYLDKPANGLPSLAPVSERVNGI
jgi:hypothetical protein